MSTVTRQLFVRLNVKMANVMTWRCHNNVVMGVILLFSGLRFSHSESEHNNLIRCQGLISYYMKIGDVRYPSVWVFPTIKKKEPFKSYRISLQIGNTRPLDYYFEIESFAWTIFPLIQTSNIVADAQIYIMKYICSPKSTPILEDVQCSMFDVWWEKKLFHLLLTSKTRRKLIKLMAKVIDGILISSSTPTISPNSQCPKAHSIRSWLESW